MSILKTTIGVLLAVVLSACGGGGGSSGGVTASSTASGTTSSSTSGTGTTATAAAPTISASITNGSSTTVTVIGTSGTFLAKAVLVDGAGAAISNKLVNFSLSSTIATLSSVTALTDGSGVATVGIAPTAGMSQGAATLTVSAVVSTSTVTATSDFASTGGGGSAASTISATITNSSGSVVTAIGSSGYFANATVKDGSGVGISNKLVNFSLNSGLASLSSTTALTNSSGVATVGISSAIGSSAGAATLTVNATVSNASLSATSDFAYSGAAITLPTFTSGSTSLVSGGNTSLSVAANIGGSPAGATPVNITLTASCGTINGTSGSAGVTTNGSGVATANYSAIQTDGTPCSGAVTLGATSGAASATPLTVNVAAPSAASVAFVGATLTNVYVSGSGAPTDSVLTFKVLDNTGAASRSTTVAFSIPTNPGGVVLSSTSGTTDNSGLVTVKVSSGTTPGPLKVRALIGSGAYAESQNLTVASGPPSQRYMSVAVSTFNVEGQNIDGTNTTVTVRLADRQGNPVQDGTVVNFTASGGQIAPSCATAKVNGIAQCSVIWQSQNPRPSNGRVAVLAYAVGTKDYIDLNGDNAFNGTDTLVQMGDPYRDDDESGVYSSSTDRFFLPLGGTAACSGSGEPVPAIANTCDSGLATIVRQQVIILNSSSSPATPVFNVTGHSTISFNLSSANNTNLPMPSGTSIAAGIVSATNATCAIKTITPTSVANISPGSNPAANLFSSHIISTVNCGAGDQISVTITAPSLLATTYFVTL